MKPPEFTAEEMIQLAPRINNHIDLRDRFAMAAMAGLLGRCMEPLAAAMTAYEYADAMMAARGKK